MVPVVPIACVFSKDFFWLKMTCHCFNVGIDMEQQQGQASFEFGGKAIVMSQPGTM